jgi:cytochrome c-type biogenesis protein
VAFIAGFTVVFVAMGVLAGTLGRFFLQYGEVLTRVLGVVVIAMGLVFLGLFGFAQRTMKPQVRSGLGLIGAPLLGVAMGIGWAPASARPTRRSSRSPSPRPTRPARCCSPSRTRWTRHPVPAARGRLRLGDALGGVPASPHPRRQHHRRRASRSCSAAHGHRVWTAAMSQLTGVIGGVELPL